MERKPKKASSRDDDQWVNDPIQSGTNGHLYFISFYIQHSTFIICLGAAKRHADVHTAARVLRHWMSFRGDTEATDALEALVEQMMQDEEAITCLRRFS